MLKEITECELGQVCYQHGLWLQDKSTGAKADLSNYNLNDRNLNFVNLAWAKLNRSELNGAKLNGAELNGAKLNWAELNGAKLNGAIGLLNPLTWLKNNFEQTKDGFIVYKAIGNTFYEIPKYWEIKEGSFIEEQINSLRSNNCGCGVNFATRDWIKNNLGQGTYLWECILHYEDLANLIVPYNTDGKARCSKLQLLKKIRL